MVCCVCLIGHRLKWLCNAVWHEKLKQYQLKRPDLRIVDSFEAVMQLTNRISMLDPVREGFLLKVTMRTLLHHASIGHDCIQTCSNNAFLVCIFYQQSMTWAQLYWEATLDLK